MEFELWLTRVRTTFPAAMAADKGEIVLSSGAIYELALAGCTAEVKLTRLVTDNQSTPVRSEDLSSSLMFRNSFS